jgi:tRNA(Ile)-lysidine synthase
MKKTELESKVLDFIERHRLILPEEIIVIGVSGGADSVCLLHILATHGQKLGAELHIAHLNHLLRGAESEADAKYVSSLANSLGIPVTIDKQNVAAYRIERNCSIEQAAREVRYTFFGRVAKVIGANRIAVGHTMDDNVETILMHILRGTGINGLCGLAPRSPLAYDRQEMSLPANTASTLKGQQGDLSVIRPLLHATREEVAVYCQEQQLDPLIDSSNFSPSFFRNRLRLQLLPLLRQYNPGIDQALLRLADIAKEDNAFIEQHASELWNDVARQEHNAVHLNRKQLTNLPIALQRQLLRAAVARVIGDTQDIEASHIEAAVSLIGKPTGKRIHLPHGLTCHGGYGEIVITSTAKESPLPPSPFPPLPLEIPLKVPGKTVFSGWNVTASIALERRDSPSLQPTSCTNKRTYKANFIVDVDLQKAGSKLFARRPRPGDRFQPLGLDMAKKLYEFMIDAKIPRSWRSHIPIVCSREQIIWVVGWRIDDRVKTTEATEEILHLEFARSE